MPRLLLTVGIGFVSGLLSGAFGIGGGIITTPAIRLLLQAPALVAVGTPLPVIIPSAITGSYNYLKRGSADLRSGLVCGITGSAFAVLGALATRYVGGTVVLLATAALILYTAADMALQVIRPPRVGLEGGEEREAFDAAGDPAETPDVPAAPSLLKLGLIGAMTGLYAGFLGLGGGFILVPMLTRWLGFPIKRAIGTSLVAIGILAVPGTITHAFLGHIDWAISLALIAGVVPGAWLGARLTLGAADKTIRLSFAVMLLFVGLVLGASELGVFGR